MKSITMDYEEYTQDLNDANRKGYQEGLSAAEKLLYSTNDQLEEELIECENYSSYYLFIKALLKLRG